MKFMHLFTSFQVIFISSMAIYGLLTNQKALLISILLIAMLATMLKSMSGSEKVANDNVREILKKHMPEISSFSILFARSGKLDPWKNFFLAVIRANNTLYKITSTEDGEEKIERLNGSKIKRFELHLGRRTHSYYIMINDYEVKYVAITEAGEGVLNSTFTVVDEINGFSDTNEMLPLRMKAIKLVFKKHNDSYRELGD